LIGVEAIGVRIGIDEDRHAAREEYRTGGAVPGIGRDDYFVAALNTNGLQRQFDRDGAVADREPVSRALRGGEARAELASFGVGKGKSTPVSAFEHFRKLAAFRIVPYRPGRERSLTQRRPAADRKMRHPDIVVELAIRRTCSSRRRLERPRELLRDLLGTPPIQRLIDLNVAAPQRNPGLGEFLLQRLGLTGR
jgi:hypothetical protein